MQKVLDKMRLLMAANALAAYPDHNKQFDVVRNGIMPHLWGINLSHIYAREVR